jgi:hypothetical protein
VGNSTGSPDRRDREMLRTVEHVKGAEIVLADSVSSLSAEDNGRIAVTGSHGGTSAGEYALSTSLQAVFFNDAGVGKDKAGIAALEMLDQAGIPAGAVSHLSARIGDARDAWDNGTLSSLNAEGRRAGWKVGDRLATAVERLLQSRSPG